MKMRFAVPLLCLISPLGHAADTYVLDPKHTHPMFAISHLGFSTTRGGFTDAKGTVTLDMASHTGSLDVTIAADSVQTAVPKLDEHLRKPDFFDVEQYPTIHFHADTLKFDGDQLVAVPGTLTMRGISHPLTLKVTHFKCGEHPFLKKPYCGADATATLNRSDWGITAYSGMLGETVTLDIQAEAMLEDGAKD